MTQSLQTLYTELISGTKHYSESGEVTSNPPTSLHLRAARTLDTLSNVNATNTQLIMRLQITNGDLVTTAENLREEVKQLLTQLTMKEENERVRNGTRETGTVDPGTSSQPDLFGSDSGSTINNANQNSSTGGN